MKKVTAALVLIDGNGSILACHATGRPDNCGYDFPKGLVEDGESDIDAAKREFSEETGVKIETLFSNGEPHIIDCGMHKHNKEKDIHIFLCRINQFPDLSVFKCKSFFDCNGKQLPEVNGYAVITKNERNKFNKVLWNKFEIIDNFNN